MYTHFNNQEPLAHIAQKRTEGMMSEMHGSELPGHTAAATDTIRETVLFLWLLWLPLHLLHLPLRETFWILGTTGLGWCVWKTGRSAWLGWTRLERLHRVIEQEKYEIEHHRPQEREELRALYSSKGFEGKLLEEVLDVLMADQDRLLKVMLEEELGLTLQVHEHPLKQALGAALGGIGSLIIALLCHALWPLGGLGIGGGILLAISAGATAYYEKNKMIPALVWNLSLGVLSAGVVYFLLKT